MPLSIVWSSIKYFHMLKSFIWNIYISKILYSTSQLFLCSTVHFLYHNLLILTIRFLHLGLSFHVVLYSTFPLFLFNFYFYVFYPFFIIKQKFGKILYSSYNNPCTLVNNFPFFVRLIFVILDFFYTIFFL